MTKREGLINARRRALEKRIEKERRREAKAIQKKSEDLQERQVQIPMSKAESRPAAALTQPYVKAQPKYKASVRRMGHFDFGKGGKKAVMVAAIVILAFASLSLINAHTAMLTELQSVDTMKLRTASGEIEASAKVVSMDSFALFSTNAKVSLQLSPKEVHPIREIQLKGVPSEQITENFGLALDDVPETVNGERALPFVEIYAIDPTAIDFESAEVTVVAKGTELYKCKEWEFNEQKCTGEWVLFRKGLVPGEAYTFELTADDPGFGEASPDEGTPDGGGAEAFGQGFDSTAGTYTATQNNDGTLFSVRQTNGGGANVDLHAWMNLSYNLTPIFSLGAASSDISNLTFNIEYCITIDNSDPITCGGSAVTGATAENPQGIALFNWTSNQWQTVSNYNISLASSAEVNLTFSVLGGFSDYIDSSSKEVRVRYAVNVTITTNGADASYGIDYAPLAVTYVVSTPAISGVNSSSTNATANITWTTSAASNSSVNYGTGPGLGTVASNSSAVSSHIVGLTGLVPATTYYYNVTSCTEGGCSTSGPYNFTTKAEVELRIIDANNTTVNTTLQIFDKDDNLSLEASYSGGQWNGQLKLGKKRIRTSHSTGPVKEINFTNVSIISGGSFSIGYDDTPESVVPVIDGGATQSLYAIDPDSLNFTSGVLTVTATGTRLYKCASWDFSARACPGGWAFLQTVTPGENYTIMINATDPGFGEQSGSAPVVTLNAPANNAVFPINTTNITLNGSFTDPEADTLVIRLFGDNTTTPGNESLLFEDRVAGGANRTYNWTSPILAREAATVLLLHFDNRTEYRENASFVRDFSVHGNNATCSPISACPAFNRTGGKFSGAFVFDGVNDSFMTAFNPPGLNFTDRITIEAWIKWRGESNGTFNLQNIVTNGHSQRALRITEPDHFNGGRQILAHFNIGGAEQTLYSTGTINESRWYYVAATYNGSVLSVYINGALDKNLSVTGQLIGTAAETFIGTEGVASFFNGTIDEVRITNRSLTAQEIQENYRLKNGTWYWYATANDSTSLTTSATRQFSIGTSTDAFPQSSGLVDNSTTSTPKKSESIQINVTLTDDSGLSRFIFSWNDSGSYVNDSAVGISGTSVEVSLNRTFNATKGTMVGYKFYFNDSAGRMNVTSTGSFAVKNTAPAVPALGLLRNSTNTSSSTPAFNWSASSDADSDSITYRIQIDNDTDFSSPVNDTSGIGGTNFTPSAISDGVYYWHVRSETSDANSSYSETRLFTIDTASPTIAFVSPTPANNSLQSSISVIINVSHTESNPDKIILVVNGAVNATLSYSGTSTLFQRNLSSGVHNFSVTANDTAGNSASTGTRFVTIDIALPQIGSVNKPADPSTFSSTATYRFNATITDNINISNVIFEFNSVNYSLASGQVSQSGSLYNKTIGTIPAGTYTYRWYANDTAGNVNSSSSATFTIDKAVTALSLDFSPSSSVSYNTTTTVTCTANNAESVPAMTRNSSSVSNPETSVLPAGTWNYACTSSATENWTSGSQTSSLTVSRTTTNLTITIVPSSTVNYGATVNASCAATNPEVSPQLFRNAAAISNPNSALLAAGSYTYSCNNTITQNYTSGSNSTALTVSQASTSTTLLLNGSALNQQAVYPTATNATATTDVLTVTLYRNGTNVSNPELATLKAGIWNYTAINPGNENYSLSDSTLFLTILKANTTINLTLNGATANLSVLYGTSTNASASTNTLSVALTRNGAGVSNPEAGILAAGAYNYTATNAGNENYSSSTLTYELRISKASNAVSLNISGSVNQNLTITLGTASNVSGTAAANSLALYRNSANVSNPDVATLVAGAYKYSANSTGNENYTANSSTFYLFVKPNITATKFNGTSTNLSSIQDTTQILDFVLDIASYGKIQWGQANFSNSTSLDLHVDITSNYTRVNATALPGLNSTATITLYNIELNDPKPQYDLEDDGTFEDCPASVCTEISYASNIFVFNVTRFTSYRAAEASPTSPPSPPSGGGSSSGGGGGAGSGGCADSWTCTSWSACTNGNRTRSCTSSNFLCTDFTKPATVESCTAACTENWVCGDWSTCTNGVETRFCTDNSKCSTTALKPAEVRDCVLPGPSCNDGIQNQDETGIDCGGFNCRPCTSDITGRIIEIESQRAPSPLLATLTIVMLLALIAVASLSRTQLSKKAKILLEGMHVLLILSLVILVAMAVSSTNILSNIVADPSSPNAMLVYAIIVGIVVFIVALTKSKSITARLKGMEGRKHRKQKGELETEYPAIRFDPSKVHGSRAAKALEKLAQDIGKGAADTRKSLGKAFQLPERKEPEIHPFHAKMTEFEHELTRKLGFMEDSLKTFRKAVLATHSDVARLHRHNRSLLKKAHVRKQGGHAKIIRRKLSEKAGAAAKAAKARLPEIPKLQAPKISIPKVQAPKINAKIPKLGGKLPKFNFNIPKMPKIPELEMPGIPKMRKEAPAKKTAESFRTFSEAEEAPKITKLPEIPTEELSKLGKELKTVKKKESSAKAQPKELDKPILKPEEARYVEHLRARYGIAPRKSAARKGGKKKW